MGGEGEEMLSGPANGGGKSEEALLQRQETGDNETCNTHHVPLVWPIHIFAWIRIGKLQIAKDHENNCTGPQAAPENEGKASARVDDAQYDIGLQAG